jgi:hypothetical protein
LALVGEARSQRQGRKILAPRDCDLSSSTVHRRSNQASVERKNRGYRQRKNPGQVDLTGIKSRVRTKVLTRPFCPKSQTSLLRRMQSARWGRVPSVNLALRRQRIIPAKAAVDRVRNRPLLTLGAPVRTLQRHLICARRKLPGPSQSQRDRLITMSVHSFKPQHG